MKGPGNKLLWRERVEGSRQALAGSAMSAAARIKGAAKDFAHIPVVGEAAYGSRSGVCVKARISHSWEKALLNSNMYPLTLS